MSDQITYTQIGDYLFPDIILNEPPREINTPLGRYGRMRKAFLKEHRTMTYNALLLSEKLYPHLRDIDETAEKRMAGAADRELAHEFILAELIYD